MKLVTLFLCASSLWGATYYVASGTSSPAGSDSNPGTSGAPFLTLAKAVAVVATDAASGTCGDIINVVADGNFIDGDATLPYLPCSVTTTIQSSKIALFQPPGFRTNPATDCASSATCLYGRMNHAGGGGITTSVETHGSNTAVDGDLNRGSCGVSLAADVFTLTLCVLGIANLNNGSQLELEIEGQGTTLTASAIPSPFVYFQKYYVVNCSGCGTSGGTFQLAATSGGPAITGTSCTGACVITQVYVTAPIQVAVSSTTFTSPDSISWIAGTPIVFGVAGATQFGTLPTPLIANQVYYVLSPSGRNFSVATSAGGSAISITNVGAGPLNASNVNVAHNWKLSGLEQTQQAGQGIAAFVIAGISFEVAAVGMVRNIELDRMWGHELCGSPCLSTEDPAVPLKCWIDNGINIYIHDSVCEGMTNGESQAIATIGSAGPSAYINNYLEAAGEITLAGGAWPLSGTANRNHFISGNYATKAPVWRISDGGSLAASGPCLYSNDNPRHTGGEYYHDATHAQWYQCGSDFLWHTSSAPPTNPFAGNPNVKSGFEQKNGCGFQYIGNVMNINWAQGQSGQFWNNSAETGSGPGFCSDHNTAMNNAVFNVWTAMNRAGQCSAPSIIAPCLMPLGDHALINNLFSLSPYACGIGLGVGFGFIGGRSTCGFPGNISGYQGTLLTGDTMRHNTFFTLDGILYPGSFNREYPFFADTINNVTCVPPLIDYSMWNDNITVGDISGCGNNTAAAINLYYTNAKFQNNAFKTGNCCGGYAAVSGTNTWSTATTKFPADNTTIAFNGADGTPNAQLYKLTSGSPYSAANAGATQLSDDNTDLGADIDAIALATSGAKAGTPTWDRLYGLQVVAGSTQAVFKYNAPTGGACTATIYSTPVRNLAGGGNIVFTGADSGAGSIRDATHAELYVSGLTASSHYWYGLACGGGVLMIGDFWTRAAGSGTYNWWQNYSSPITLLVCPTAAMGCGVTQSSAAPITVTAGGLAYVSPNPSASVPQVVSILIAP